MVSKSKVLISISLIAAALLAGLLVYLVIANRETEIYVISYDREVRFSLGRTNVRNISRNQRRGDVFFSVRGGDMFFEDNVVNSNYLITTHRYPWSRNTTYILLYRGYYFAASRDDAGVVIENLSVQFETMEGEYFFQFPTVFIDSPSIMADNFYPWSAIPLANNFNELAEFYRRKNPGQVEIIPQTNTIRLRAFGTEFREITQDKPIVIRATAQGVSITLER